MQFWHGAGRCAIVQTMQASSVWILGLRNLWRDLRAGELRLIIVAVLLAVAALSSVGFLPTACRPACSATPVSCWAAMWWWSATIPHPRFLCSRHSSRAADRGHGQLSDHGAGRPGAGRCQPPGGAQKRGPRLPVARRAAPESGTGPARPGSRAIPERGHAWVDAPLLEALGLKLGDRLLLGDASFHISHIIAIEPDRGAGFMSFAPRVMINSADLPATRLVQPASRITYRLAVAAQADAGRGAQRAAQDYLGWAQELAKSLHGVRVESLESGRPEMRQTLDRAEKFLSLVALLSALLSAVAVALAARAFANSHLDASAMLRVLGQSQRRIALAYVVEFVSIALAASAAGVLLGWAVHHVFVWLLAGLVESALPAASLWPALFGMGMGLTLLLAFGLPPVLQLAQVPPLRVMRRDLGALKPASWLVLGVGVTGFAALLMVASRDIKLGLIAVGGFAVAVLLFAGLAWLAVKLLRQVVNESTAPRWLVMATRQVSAKPVYAVVQVSSLAVGLLALVLLVLLRTDLIASWRKATPANAPDRFVINVQPDQAQDFQAALKKAGVHSYDWYPMIRGRLIAVNGKAVSPDDYEEDRAKRLVDREFNISTAETMPDHNQIVAAAGRRASRARSAWRKALPRPWA
jgi:putative ABC transport system permease protein